MADDDSVLSVRVVFDGTELTAGMQAAVDTTLASSSKMQTALGDVSKSAITSSEALNSSFDISAAAAATLSESVQSSMAATSLSIEEMEQNARTNIARLKDDAQGSSARVADIPIASQAPRKTDEQYAAEEAAGESDTDAMRAVAAGQGAAVASTEELAAAETDAAASLTVTTEAAGTQSSAMDGLASSSGVTAGSMDAVTSSSDTQGTALNGAAAAAAGTASAQTALQLAQQAVAAATVENATAQAVVRDMLKAISTGEIPQTSRVMGDLAIAQAEAAGTAQALAAAQKELQAACATTGKSFASAQQEAALLSRTLGLNLGRAMEQIIGRAPVLAAAMQAIFPVVIAIAVGEMIYKMGKDIHEWGKAGYEAAEKITEGFNQLIEKESESDDQIALTNAKLQDQIDKLEGKPGNGLAVALAETAVQADRLADHLRAALEVSEKLLKSQQVGAFKGAVLGLATTGPAADLVKDIQRQQNEAEGKKTWALSQASQMPDSHPDVSLDALQAKAKVAKPGPEQDTLQEELNQKKAKQDAILKAEQDFQNAQLRIARDGRDEAKRQADAAEAAQSSKHYSAGPGGERIEEGNDDYGARIAALRGVQGEMGAAVIGMEGSQTTESLQTKLGTMHEGKTEDSAQQKLNDDTAKGAEIRKKAADDIILAGAAADVAAGKMTVLAEAQLRAKLHTEEQSVALGVLRTKMNDISLDKSLTPTQRKDEQQKVQNEIDQKKGAGTVQSSADQKAIQEATKKDDEEQQKLNAAIADGAEIRRKSANETALAGTASAVATGKMTALGAAQLKAKVHAEDQTAALVKLDAEMKAISDNKSITPAQRTIQTQEVNNKIDQQKGKGQTQGIQDQASITEALKRESEEQQKLSDAVADGVDIRRKEGDSLQLVRTDMQLTDGRITALGAAQKEAAIHADEHRAALAKLDAEMKAINANPFLTPDQKKLESQKVQNKMDQEKGEGNVQAAKDSNKIAQQLAAPYQQAAKLISSSATSGFNSWIDGSKKASAALLDSARSIELGMIQSLERVAERQLQMEIMKLVRHQVTNQMQVAGDAAAATESATINKAADEKDAMADAKKAGKHAFTSAMKLPFPINTIVAPIAAAAAFVAVMAFEQGGVAGEGLRLGTAVPIVAHAGERILTTSQTQMFNQMVNNQSSSQRGGDVNMQNHFHNATDPKATADQVFGNMLRYVRSSGVRRR